MILSKKLEKRYYLDLNDISVWRWDMVSTSNDYKYICREGQKPCRLAAGVYQSLIFQFDSLNLASLQEQRDIVVQVLDFISGLPEEDLTLENIEDIGTVVQGLLIDPIGIPIDFLFNIIKEPELRTQLSFIKLARRQYQAQETTKKTQTLIERVARCAKAMGTHLDIKKVSIVQFLAYEKEAFNNKK